MLMEIDLGFLEDNEVDVKSGIEYTGGKEKYLSALKRYYQNPHIQKSSLKKTTS